MFALMEGPPKGPVIKTLFPVGIHPIFTKGTRRDPKYDAAASLTKGSLKKTEHLWCLSEKWLQGMAKGNQAKGPLNIIEKVVLRYALRDCSIKCLEIKLPYGQPLAWKGI